MSREIKFRFWNSEAKFMTEGDDPGMTEREWAVACYTPMQYTGLKDKNGVEIYEGDIVKSYTKNYIVRFGPYMTGTGCQGESNSSCVGFNLKLIGGTSWDASKHLRGDIECIGNIYENPELLGESSDL